MEQIKVDVISCPKLNALVCLPFSPTLISLKAGIILDDCPPLCALVSSQLFLVANVLVFNGRLVRL